MKIEIEIDGVAPEQLAKLHEIVEGPATRSTRFCNWSMGMAGRTLDQQRRLCRICKSFFVGGCYTVTLEIESTFVCESTVDTPESRFADKIPGVLFVSLGATKAIFDALGIFPETEYFVPERKKS